MYITETIENVRTLINELEIKGDITKLKFLIYVFGLVNNSQINDKNEPNPDLIEDEKLKIFRLDLVGLPENACTVLLQYFATLYNRLTEKKEAYEDNGNVLGIKLNKEDKELSSLFEKLNFNEKLDVISEIIIKYDNETYFDKKIAVIFFDSENDGFNLALQIKKFKM